MLTVEAVIKDAQGERIALSIGNRPDILFLSRGLAHHGLGHYEQAKAFYESELESSRQSGQLPQTAKSLRALGQVHLDLGQPEQAFAPVEEALKLAREMASPSLILACLTTRARAHLHRNQPLEALSSSQEAVGILEQGQSYAAPQEIYFAHALALCAHDRQPEATRYLKLAYLALKNRAEGISDPERRASFLRNVQAHREILEAWERAQH